MTWTWTLKRLAISAFLAVHLAALAIWNLPPCAIKGASLIYAAYYMMPLGLWQYWGMFSEPARDTAVLEALVVDAKGLLHEHTFPATADLPAWRAAFLYRDAKLQANMASEDFRAHREMVARHVVRSLDLPAADFPVVVQLQYRVRATPEPGAPPADPPPAVTVPVQAYRYATPADAQP